VLLRRSDGIYTGEPLFLNPDLVRAVERLGVAVAFTMSSEITNALLQQLTPFQTEISLDPRGFVLPIANSVLDIATGKCPVSRDAYVCLCRQERMVLIWGDTVPGIRKWSCSNLNDRRGLIMDSGSRNRCRDATARPSVGITYPFAQRYSCVSADSATNADTTSRHSWWRCKDIAVSHLRPFERRLKF
jgi:hypothetical protein